MTVSLFTRWWHFSKELLILFSNLVLHLRVQFFHLPIDDRFDPARAIQHVLLLPLEFRFLLLSQVLIDVVDISCWHLGPLS